MKTMYDSFFGIRENIEDFVKKEIKSCCRFTFVSSKEDPENFTFEESCGNYWLLKTRNGKMIHEFMLELQKKFEQHPNFFSNTTTSNEKPKYLYLVLFKK